MLHTKNFIQYEFEYSDTAKANALINTLPKELEQHLWRLMQTMQSIRDYIGYPIKITSGYRSVILNRIVGGVSNSAHCLGYACDFYCRDISVSELYKQVCRFLEENNMPFDQCIIEKSGRSEWIHLSVDPTNRRQFLKIVK